MVGEGFLNIARLAFENFFVNVLDFREARPGSIKVTRDMRSLLGGWSLTALFYNSQPGCAAR